MDILVAHPYKHHALELAAGCAKSGHKVALAVPMYRQGIGALLSHLPGRPGRKSSGYYHEGLDNVSKVTSPTWQIRRVLNYLSKSQDFHTAFDAYLQKKIKSKVLRPRLLVALQDYLPQTIISAREEGIEVWSDQIINLSDSAIARINKHYAALNRPPIQHSEDANKLVLAAASYVTIPSQYTLEGIQGLIPAHAIVRKIPYGFSKSNVIKRRPDPRYITIVARANTVRKGGHLLIRALGRVHELIRSKAYPKRLRVIVLGEFEFGIRALASDLIQHTGIDLVARDFAHSDVWSLLANADLFVMPTLSESMSLACVEAMCAGVPIITTLYAGLDRFIDREMGVIVEDSEESLANGLIYAIERQEMWTTWGTNGQQVCIGGDWNYYQSSICKLVQEILAQPSQIGLFKLQKS